MNNELY